MHHELSETFLVLTVLGIDGMMQCFEVVFVERLVGELVLMLVFEGVLVVEIVVDRT